MPSLARATLVHFVYHTSRSSMEVPALLGWVRAHEPPGAATARPRRTVLKLCGPAFAATADDGRRELVRALLWQAELVKVVLERDGNNDVAVGFPRPGRPEDERDFDWETLPGPASAHFLTAADYRHSVARALEAGRHPHRALQRFFVQFDAETSDDLIAELGWHTHQRELVESDVAFVRAQLLASLAERRADPDGRFAPTRLRILGDELQRVGERLRLLVVAHGLDPAQLDEALERFACGELRLELDCRAVCCQPSSAFFFLFAELALALHAQAFEHRLAPTRWDEPLLLAFARSAVRSQEHFVAAYGSYARAERAAGRAPGLADYRAFDFDPRSVPVPEMRAAKHAEFAPLTPAELCRRSAENARVHLDGWDGR